MFPHHPSKNRLASQVHGVTLQTRPGSGRSTLGLPVLRVLARYQALPHRGWKKKRKGRPGEVACPRLQAPPP